jgi:hypothetical protein
MKLRDITDAIANDERTAVRRAFLALVCYPGDDRIEASSPGLLVVALNRVCAYLAQDGAPMPRIASDALDLAPSSSYAAGVAEARRRLTDLSRRIVENFAT